MTTLTPHLQLQDRQKKVRLSLRALQQKFERALKLLPARKQKKLPKELEITLVTRAEMKSIHARFLNDDSETDVITFPYGEILICPEVAKKQAHDYGRKVEDEVFLYGLHGFLHLLGYKDKTKAEFQRMSRAQEKWFQAVAKKK